MVTELLAKTLIKNCADREREIKWAGVSLKAGEVRLVDGLFPSACKTEADQKLMMAEIDAAKVEVILITNLPCAGIDSLVAAKAGGGKYAGLLTGQVQKQILSTVRLREERVKAEAALLEREAESRGHILSDDAVEKMKLGKDAALKDGSPMQRGSLNDVGNDPLLFRETAAPKVHEKHDVFGRTPKDATEEAKGPKILIASEAQETADRFQLTATELSTIRGSGRGGRILNPDVTGYLEKKGVEVNA